MNETGGNKRLLVNIMLIEAPPDVLKYGYLRIHPKMKVLELEGRGYMSDRHEVMFVGYDIVDEVINRASFVVIEKDLDFHTLWSVLTAFPYLSRIVVVSLSSRKPYDRYFDEVRLFRLMRFKTGHWIGAFTLHDPTWGEVLEKTPFKGMLKDDGTVKPGRAEAYVLGTLVANWMASDLVGYLDGNNLLAGTAFEYMMSYLTIFSCLRDYNNVMTRIKRTSTGDLATSNKLIRKIAKVNQIVNDVFNTLISRYKGEYVDFIQTGYTKNIAMTMEMADNIPWAATRTPEVYQLVYLLDKCWISKRRWYECPFAASNAYIFQIEPVTPHIQYDVSDEELFADLVDSLAVIYHSRIADDFIKEKIMNILKRFGYEEDEPPRPTVYPPTSSVEAIDVIDEYVEKSEIAYLPL